MSAKTCGINSGQDATVGAGRCHSQMVVGILWWYHSQHERIDRASAVQLRHGNSAHYPSWSGLRWRKAAVCPRARSLNYRSAAYCMPKEDWRGLWGLGNPNLALSSIGANWQRLSCVPCMTASAPLAVPPHICTTVEPLDPY